MKTLRTLKISPNAPDVNSVWLHKGTAKYFNNGAWQSIGSSLNWEDILNKPTFSRVATSGSYNDLSNKPTPYTLPSASPTLVGGVKSASAVSNLSTEATLSTVIATINTLLNNLRSAGIVVNA